MNVISHKAAPAARLLLSLCCLLTVASVRAQEVTYHLNNGRSIHNVKMLTRIDGGLVLRSENNQVDTVKVSDIASIETSSQGMDNPDGLDDMLILRDGTKLCGRVIRQVPGESFTLLKKGTGGLVNISAEKLRTVKKVRRNKEIDFWEQRPYTNTIVTENSTYTGIIIEQNCGENPDDPEDDYVVIFTDLLRLSKKVYTKDILNYSIKY